MKTILLIRHAEATGQDANDGLTVAGTEQASALAHWLSREPIDRIVSSPFLRALQTAEPLAERFKLAVESDDRLIERVLCGKPRDDWRELLAASFEDLDACLPGGESSRTALERVSDVIRDALNHDAPTTALVTHGCLLTLALKFLDDCYGFAQWEALQCPDVYRVTVDSEATVIRKLDGPVVPDGSSSWRELTPRQTD